MFKSRGQIRGPLRPLRKSESKYNCRVGRPGSLWGLVKMKMLFRQPIRQMNNRGSYTLEASIILPTIMFSMFFLTCFSMWAYQRLVVLDTAIYTSKQRAVTWDNSIKELETGSKAGSLATDGLYWRLFSDYDNSDLAVTKCRQASALASHKLGTGVFKIKEQGVVLKYNNQVTQRKVTAQVNQNVLLPQFMQGLVGSDLEAKADALVAEPAEYIRMVDYLLGVPEDTSNIQPGAQVYITLNEQLEKVYHTDPYCQYVRTIVEHGNLIIVSSVEEAQANQYRLCKICATKQTKQ